MPTVELGTREFVFGGIRRACGLMVFDDLLYISRELGEEQGIFGHPLGHAGARVGKHQAAKTAGLRESVLHGQHACWFFSAIAKI